MQPAPISIVICGLHKFRKLLMEILIKIMMMTMMKKTQLTFSYLTYRKKRSLYLNATFNMVTDGRARLNKNLKLIVIILATFILAIKISRQNKMIRQLTSLPFHFGKIMLFIIFVAVAIVVGQLY